MQFLRNKYQDYIRRMVDSSTILSKGGWPTAMLILSTFRRGHPLARLAVLRMHAQRCGDRPADGIASHGGVRGTRAAGACRAIARVKRGRTKVITVTPEGAYRGDIASRPLSRRGPAAAGAPSREARRRPPAGSIGKEVGRWPMPTHYVSTTLLIDRDDWYGGLHPSWEYSPTGVAPPGRRLGLGGSKIVHLL